MAPPVRTPCTNAATAATSRPIEERLQDITPPALVADYGVTLRQAEWLSATFTTLGHYIQQPNFTMAEFKRHFAPFQQQLYDEGLDEDTASAFLLDIAKKVTTRPDRTNAIPGVRTSRFIEHFDRDRTPSENAAPQDDGQPESSRMAQARADHAATIRAAQGTSANGTNKRPDDESTTRDAEHVPIASPLAAPGGIWSPAVNTANASVKPANYKAGPPKLSKRMVDLRARLDAGRANLATTNPATSQDPPQALPMGEIDFHTGQFPNGEYSFSDQRMFVDWPLPPKPSRRAFNLQYGDQWFGQTHDLKAIRCAKETMDPFWYWSLAPDSDRFAEIAADLSYFNTPENSLKLDNLEDMIKHASAKRGASTAEGPLNPAQDCGPGRKCCLTEGLIGAVLTRQLVFTDEERRQLLADDETRRRERKDKDPKPDRKKRPRRKRRPRADEKPARPDAPTSVSTPSDQQINDQITAVDGLKMRLCKTTETLKVEQSQKALDAMTVAATDLEKACDMLPEEIPVKYIHGVTQELKVACTLLVKMASAMGAKEDEMKKTLGTLSDQQVNDKMAAVDKLKIQLRKTADTLKLEPSQKALDALAVAATKLQKASAMLPEEVPMEYLSGVAEDVKAAAILLRYTASLMGLGDAEVKKMLRDAESSVNHQTGTVDPSGSWSCTENAPDSEWLADPSRAPLPLDVKKASAAIDERLKSKYEVHDLPHPMFRNRLSDEPSGAEDFDENSTDKRTVAAGCHDSGVDTGIPDKTAPGVDLAADHVVNLVVDFAVNDIHPHDCNTSSPRHANDSVRVEYDDDGNTKIIIKGDPPLIKIARTGNRMSTISDWMPPESEWIKVNSAVPKSSSTPVLEHPTPAPEDSTPAPEDSTPAPEDSTPVPEESNPVPEHSTPITEDPNPFLENSPNHDLSLKMDHTIAIANLNYAMAHDRASVELHEAAAALKRFCAQYARHAALLVAIKRTAAKSLSPHLVRPVFIPSVADLAASNDTAGIGRVFSVPAFLSPPAPTNPPARRTTPPNRLEEAFATAVSYPDRYADGHIHPVFICRAELKADIRARAIALRAYAMSTASSGMDFESNPLLFERHFKRLKSRGGFFELTLLKGMSLDDFAVGECGYGDEGGGGGVEKGRDGRGKKVKGGNGPKKGKKGKGKEGKGKKKQTGKQKKVVKSKYRIPPRTIGEARAPYRDAWSAFVESRTRGGPFWRVAAFEGVDWWIARGEPDKLGEGDEHDEDCGGDEGREVGVEGRKSRQGDGECESENEGTKPTKMEMRTEGSHTEREITLGETVFDFARAARWIGDEEFKELVLGCGL